MNSQIQDELAQLLWTELKALPFGTWTTVDDLIDLSPKLKMLDNGNCAIAEHNDLVDYDDIEEASERLWEFADEEGLFFDDADSERFALRSFTEPGRPIDFKNVSEMAFETFVYIKLDGNVSIALEDDKLTLDSGLFDAEESNNEIIMTAEPAEQLTQLFEEFGVNSWKRDYEPQGYRVLDGEGWSLTVIFDDETLFLSQGSNAWPEGFDELKDGLLKIFN